MRFEQKEQQKTPRFILTSFFFFFFFFIFLSFFFFFFKKGEFEDHILDVDGKFKNVVVYGLLKTKYLGLLEHKP